MTPTWILRVAEIASRVAPPLLRAIRARRLADDAEARKARLRRRVQERLTRRRK
jgi:hypothetical protein